MATTIQVSPELLRELILMKLHEKESYEEIIWDMIEDRMELSEQTKKNIKKAEKDIQQGKWENFSTLEEVKEELGLDV